MALDDDLTLEAVRRAHAAPREVTADRALLVALILGPTLIAVAVLWQGLDAKAADLAASLDAVSGCGDLCAAASTVAAVGAAPAAD